MPLPHHRTTKPYMHVFLWLEPGQGGLDKEALLSALLLLYSQGTSVHQDQGVYFLLWLLARMEGLGQISFPRMQPFFTGCPCFSHSRCCTANPLIGLCAHTLSCFLHSWENYPSELIWVPPLFQGMWKKMSAARLYTCMCCLVSEKGHCWISAPLWIYFAVLSVRWCPRILLF